MAGACVVAPRDAARRGRDADHAGVGGGQAGGAAAVGAEGRAAPGGDTWRWPMPELDQPGTRSLVPGAARLDVPVEDLDPACGRSRVAARAHHRVGADDDRAGRRAAARPGCRRARASGRCRWRAHVEEGQALDRDVVLDRDRDAVQRAQLVAVDAPPSRPRLACSAGGLGVDHLERVELRRRAPRCGRGSARSPRPATRRPMRSGPGSRAPASRSVHGSCRLH